MSRPAALILAAGFAGLVALLFLFGGSKDPGLPPGGDGDSTAGTGELPEGPPEIRAAVERDGRDRAGTAGLAADPVAAAEAPAGFAQLVGRVIGPDGAPLAGAAVYPAPPDDAAILREFLVVQGVSGEDGAFRLSVPQGILDLVVHRAGYRPAVVPNVVAEGGRRVDLGAISLSAGRAISGVVVDENGRPVAGASVVAFRDPALVAEALLPGPAGVESWGGRAVADERGEFRASGLGDGEHHLIAEGIDVESAGDPVKAVAGATGVRIVVRRVRVATALVLDDSTGEPVPGATVTVTIRGPRWGGNFVTETDEDGRFVVDLSDERLAGEEIRLDLLVVSDAHEEFTREDLAPADAAPEAALVLRLIPAPPKEPGRLRGRVLYDVGRPFANARLTLAFSRRNRPSQVFMVETGPGGEFLVEGITPGEYALRSASRNGRTLIDVGQTLVITPGGEEHADVTLPRGADVEVTVVDARGDPIRSAQVTVLDAEGRSAGSWIAPAGVVPILDVSPGVVTVQAVAPGYAGKTVSVDAARDAATPVRIVLEPR